MIKKIVVGCLLAVVFMPVFGQDEPRTMVRKALDNFNNSSKNYKIETGGVVFDIKELPFTTNELIHQIDSILPTIVSMTKPISIVRKDGTEGWLCTTEFEVKKGDYRFLYPIHIYAIQQNDMSCTLFVQSYLCVKNGEERSTVNSFPFKDYIDQSDISKLIDYTQWTYLSVFVNTLAAKLYGVAEDASTN